MGVRCSKSRDFDASEDWNAMYASQAHGQSEYVASRRKSQRSGTGGIRKSTQGIYAVNGYAKGKMLGKGAYGEVFLATKGGEKFALKVLKKSALKKVKTGRQGSALDTVKTEIATMKKIAHPNCVHMFDVIVDPSHDEICFLLEFVDGGASQKSDSDGMPLPLSKKTIWSFMRHLLMGLEYLHMHGIVHRDIKPENLLLNKRGVLKIADFGTSCLCEGDANAQKTAGTPAFFAPELCSVDTSGTYDARVVDLWAVGVTLYMWICGRPPYQAPTTMLLMAAISGADGVTKAPLEAYEKFVPAQRSAKWLVKNHGKAAAAFNTATATANTTGGSTTSVLSKSPEPEPVQSGSPGSQRSRRASSISGRPRRFLGRYSSSSHVAGLAEVVEGLLTKDVDTRLTLNALRFHPWLTDNDKQPLPMQPVMQVEVTPEEVEQAFTNRQAIAYMSASGPSTFGMATGYQPNWKREGPNVIRKRATKNEADFYRDFAASGHLAPHIPVLYSIQESQSSQGIAANLLAKEVTTNLSNHLVESSKPVKEVSGGLISQATSTVIPIAKRLISQGTSSSMNTLASSSPRAHEGTSPSADPETPGATPRLSKGSTQRLSKGDKSEVLKDSSFSKGHDESSGGPPNVADPDRSKQVSFNRTSVPETPREKPKNAHKGIVSADDEVYDVRMQDLAAGMTKPCAMSFVLGVRTATPADFHVENSEPRPELLEACKALDVNSPTAEEEAVGGMTQLRHLDVLDSVSSTKALGFRIDAAKTIVDGTIAQLPLPPDKTFATIKTEEEVSAALETFVQKDASVAHAAATKLDALATAVARSHEFYRRRTLLRSTILLMFDDMKRENVELKMMNFGFSYEIPNDDEDVTHTAPWNGKPDHHEDGWLTGVKQMSRVFKELNARLKADAKNSSPPKSSPRKSLSLGGSDKNEIEKEPQRI